ncbi:MAG: O-acetyl-ADP-ribose deacetylase [Bryobacterales bacterium]|nr:O-acetyl-ADP-ribose deacetylase [Bryobacteraceae bacterium]MDW8353936.1 O-acetyl-ADP-ribose deacetylase [Bryobacterales bacterium]
MERRFPNGSVLRLMIGDITKVPADAIVNAANSALRGGGGVDGAIHRAGGPEIMKELDVIRERTGGCPTGSAVATTAGRLPARYVFHAVGPIWRGGTHNEAELLASCYRTCLQMAEERGVQVITFPSISTGAYGYPVREAAAVALRIVRDWLARPENKVREAVFVLFDEATYRAYAEAAEKEFGGGLDRPAGVGSRTG